MPGADSDLPFFSPAENRSWHEIRGSLASDAARMLYQYAFESSPEGVAVEIGTYAGRSAVCIGRALRDSKKKSKLTLIDVHFQPDLLTNLEAFGLADSIDAVAASSLEAAEEWKKKISFIYIDGHHGKAHAYADFLIWERHVMPGGVIALDDTLGFQLGPVLQIEAAVRSGAYEILLSLGGQSYLRKKRAIMPGIGDYPMLPGSMLAYVNYVSAWIAAMDPELRLPVLAPWREPAAPPAPPPKRLLDRILDASPRSLARFAVRKVGNGRSAGNSSAPASPPALSRFEVMAHPPCLPERPLDVLEWLETMSELDPQDRATVSYLRAAWRYRGSARKPRSRSWSSSANWKRSHCCTTTSRSDNSRRCAWPKPWISAAAGNGPSSPTARCSATAQSPRSVTRPRPASRAPFGSPSSPAIALFAPACLTLHFTSTKSTNTDRPAIRRRPRLGMTWVHELNALVELVSTRQSWRPPRSHVPAALRSGGSGSEGGCLVLSRLTMIGEKSSLGSPGQ